jgi:hypothetical protein
MNQNELMIMKKLSQLNCDGFPKVYSSGFVKNFPYIVLEKLGISLKDLLL